MTIGIPILQIVQENENGLLSADPSWSRVLLGEVAQVLNGFAFPSKNFSRVKGKPLLRIRDILQDQTAVLYDHQYDTAYLVHPNDLVIGMDGDFNCALWKGPEALLNQRVCKVTSNELFYSSKFLKYVLPGYLQAVNARTSSQTVKHLSSKTVADIPLPLPPLPEQHRIVAKMEELFTRLDAGVEALKKIKAQLKRYRQSVLKHAFEGKLTEGWRQAHQHELEPASVLLERIKQERLESAKGKNKELPQVDTSELPELPEGWVWTIGDIVFSFVTSGSRGWAKYYSESGLLFLRMGNLDHDSISLDLGNVQRVCPPPSAEGFRTRVTEGDILISITGDVGMIALIPEGFEEAYINQHVALARPGSVINKSYMAWFLSSREGGQHQFLKLQRGATKMGLGLDDIRSVNIPIAPLVEQRQIISEIERRFSVADQIEKTVDHGLKQGERLRQSILKRVFEGKLVPQDPNDEPAEKLLERIRQERARQQAERKPAKSSRNKSNTKQMRFT